MGHSLTGKPEGEGCKEKTWWEKNEKCAYSFQDDEEKSRWFFLTLEGPASNDLGVLIWEGKLEPLASCLYVALLLGRGKQRKNSFSFSTEELQFGNLQSPRGRRRDRDVSVRAQWVASARENQPNRLYKRNFRFPSRKVQGSLATGIAGSRASGIGADLLSLHSTLFPVTSLLSSACFYNSCLHLQARVLSDYYLLVK